MSLEDLAKYDFATLVMADHRGPTRVAEFIHSLSHTLIGYLNQELRNVYDAQADPTFWWFLLDYDGPHTVSPEQLVSGKILTFSIVAEFYKRKLPDLGPDIDLLVLQFQKGFITDFYRNTIQAAQEQGIDPEIYPRLLLHAERDEWDDVACLVQSAVQDDK